MGAGPQGMSQGIRVEDLLVRYGDLEAVAGLSFEVPGGQTLALLGPNGAGKTSTVRCLAGLQAPQEGRLFLCGLDVGRQPEGARARLGYVPEQGSLYGALTPRETLLLKGRLHGMEEARVRRRARHLCGILGLSERYDDPIGGLSKGMRQKVVLATALLHDPEVLILDEPLGGLDAETTELVKELLRLLKARGRAILYCSHLLDVVEKVADRVLILSRGKKVALGSLSELRRRKDAKHHPSLESAFRELTLAEDPRVKAERLLSWPD